MIANYRSYTVSRRSWVFGDGMVLLLMINAPIRERVRSLVNNYCYSVTVFIAIIGDP